MYDDIYWFLYWCIWVMSFPALPILGIPCTYFQANLSRTLKQLKIVHDSQKSFRKGKVPKLFCKLKQFLEEDLVHMCEALYMYYVGILGKCSIMWIDHLLGLQYANTQKDRHNVWHLVGASRSITVCWGNRLQVCFSQAGQCAPALRWFYMKLSGRGEMKALCWKAAFSISPSQVSQ